MHRHRNHGCFLLSGLTAAAVVAFAGAASAGEPLPDRQGFGYAIQFAPGDGAALLPVPERQALIERPGFGYAIAFAPGDGAVLLPVPERQALIERQGFGYTINFVPGDPADSLFPPGWAKQRVKTSPEG